MTSSPTATYPSLNGRGVFITGGASGIGASLVDAFVSKGANVAFVDINEDQAAALVDRLQIKFGKSVWYRDVDITVSGDLESAVKDACKDMGGLHTLINNAASDVRHDVEEFGAEKWRKCIALNLDAAYLAARAAFIEMKGNEQGAIINMSSISATLGLGGMPGYVTAKAGLVGMTKALARDFGEYNIRVNAILPGWVVTERQLENWLTPDQESDWVKHVALKRRLRASDVANLALFLSADDSEMITGQSLVIDAGRT